MLFKKTLLTDVDGKNDGWCWSTKPLKFSPNKVSEVWYPPAIHVRTICHRILSPHLWQPQYLEFLKVHLPCMSLRCNCSRLSFFRFIPLSICYVFASWWCGDRVRTVNYFGVNAMHFQTSYTWECILLFQFTWQGSVSHGYIVDKFDIYTALWSYKNNFLL